MTEGNRGVDEQALFTAGGFREFQDGRTERDPEVHRHAGIARDETVSRYLARLAEAYDPTEADAPEELPGTAWDLAHVQRIVRMSGTETARKAFNDGDYASLKHMMGDTQQRADVSGLMAIEDLKAMVAGPATMFYEWAEPGTGKTNFALLLAQLWKRERGDDALLASNIRTLRETDEWTDASGTTHSGWLSSFGELEEWLEQDGDPLENEQRPKLFIFDEASSNARGSGESGYETKTKMGPLAYKIRKFGGALILIGHDGKDVHPLIRELGVAVHKESKKRAVFYDDVKNRQGVGERLAVEGIPPTDYRYDDKEPTTWSWDRTEEDDEDDHLSDDDLRVALAIRKRKHGHSTQETADFVGMSTGWVSTRWQEYKEDGQHREKLNRLSEVFA